MNAIETMKTISTAVESFAEKVRVEISEVEIYFYDYYFSLSAEALDETGYGYVASQEWDLDEGTYVPCSIQRKY